METDSEKAEDTQVRGQLHVINSSLAASLADGRCRARCQSIFVLNKNACVPCLCPCALRIILAGRS